jgi:hypothetical protein
MEMDLNTQTQITLSILENWHRVPICKLSKPLWFQLESNFDSLCQEFVFDVSISQLVISEKVFLLILKFCIQRSSSCTLLVKTLKTK